MSELSPGSGNTPDDEDRLLLETGAVANILVFLQSQGLQEIDEICPGYPQKILDEAIEDSRHLRNIERMQVALQQEAVNLAKRQQRQSETGTWLGAAIVAFAIGCMTYLGASDKPGAAGAIGGSLAASAGIITALRGIERRKSGQNPNDTAD